MFFSTTRKAQTSGVLLPDTGVIRVMSNQSGFVTEKRVSEGQLVKAGDVLFVLQNKQNTEHNIANAKGKEGLDGQVNDVAKNHIVDTQETISALLQKRRDSFTAELKQANVQTQQRLAALQNRLVDIKTASVRAQEQIVLQQQRVQIAEQNFKRFSDLQATHFISAAQLQDRQAELIDQRSRLADLQRAQVNHQRELSAAQAEVSEVNISAQREQVALRRNVSSLEQDLTEYQTRREFVVVAPQDGIVTAMTVELGQTVNANQALASILPSVAQLEAEIYAPSRAVGFVKPGMKVLLRYQAYPYQKFGQYGATVREVASTSLRPEELALPGAANGGSGEPVYRIRLHLDKQDILAYGKTLPLKSGMLVDASVLLEERRLYEWVLEPLFSISGRM